MTNSAASQGRFGAAFEWLGVERAWQKTRGSADVVIGIVDEGVQVDHPLLGPNIQHDLAHNPAAGGSHEIAGTHAAGVAAGRFSEVEQFSGIAPDARILPVRFSNGVGPQSLDLSHAIEYAVEMGACIINVSPVGEVAEPSVKRAIQYAAARNVLVVCSALDATSPMAMAHEERVPNVLNVLSIGEQWQPMATCGRQAAHLAAPGFARVPQWRGSGYSMLLGNAIGAAYVSGCAALVKTLHPAWGYHEIKEHLLASSTTHPVLEGRCQSSAVLNVANAVLGPIELVGDARPLTWPSLHDAVIEWKLRYRAALCINVVALFRPHGDAHWRELAVARASSMKMIIPGEALRRSSGTLRLACRESSFSSEEVSLTVT
jgi:subtilisin family serine protease